VSIKKMFVSDKLVGIWKEAAVALFKLLFLALIKGTEVNHEKCHHMRQPGQSRIQVWT
jgi:hypothetical protein